MIATFSFPSVWSLLNLTNFSYARNVQKQAHYLRKMKRQLCCVLTIPWHCCICFCFWIGKWTPTMEKGHPRYLTAVIKMPPETSSVGRCLRRGVYSNNLVPRSHSVFRWNVVWDWASHTWLVDYFCIQVAEKETQISLTQSLGLIIQGGQCVSGHLVPAKKWDVSRLIDPEISR